MPYAPLKRATDPERSGPNLPSRDVQELWFATRRRDWRTLCIVPGSPDCPTLPVATALAEVGRNIRRSALRVVNANAMELDQIADLALLMSTGVQASPPAPSTVWTSASLRNPGGPAADEPLIVALGSVVANPLLLPLALAADAVLLAIELGRSDLDEARRTVDLIGRDRLVGSVLLGAR